MNGNGEQGCNGGLCVAAAVAASPLSGQMAVGGCCAPLSHLTVSRGSRSVSCNTSLIDDLLVTGFEGVQAILEIASQLGKQGDGPA